MFCTVDVINRAAYRAEQMEYDAQYVDDISLGLDIKTFFGVIAPVITGRGVYKDEHDKAIK
jgi:O-antigen biosynthesis protein WbqP